MREGPLASRGAGGPLCGQSQHVLTEKKTVVVQADLHSRPRLLSTSCPVCHSRNLSSLDLYDMGPSNLK